MDSSGHFLDQDRRESVCSQFLVYAKEVNLSHFNLGIIDLAREHIHKAPKRTIAYVEVDWNAWNEPDELLVLPDSDSNHPFWVVSWWSQCPNQKFSGVIETEHSIFIFDVVFQQEIVELTISENRKESQERITSSTCFSLWRSTTHHSNCSSKGYGSFGTAAKSWFVSSSPSFKKQLESFLNS